MIAGPRLGRFLVAFFLLCWLLKPNNLFFQLNRSCCGRGPGCAVDAAELVAVVGQQAGGNKGDEPRDATHQRCVLRDRARPAVAQLVESSCFGGFLEGRKEVDEDNEEESTRLVCTCKQKVVVTTVRLALGGLCAKD